MTPQRAAKGDEECAVVNSLYGHVCGRDKGHDGPHIEFRDNGVVAWGLSLPHTQGEDDQ